MLHSNVSSSPITPVALHPPRTRSSRAASWTLLRGGRKHINFNNCAHFMASCELKPPVIKTSTRNATPLLLSVHLSVYAITLYALGLIRTLCLSTKETHIQCMRAPFYSALAARIHNFSLVFNFAQIARTTRKVVVSASRAFRINGAGA